MVDNCGILCIKCDMADQGNEITYLPLPDEGTKDYFKILVQNCIRTYARTYSDMVALDANAVLGKMRVMILDDPTYRRETKKIKAQKTINDLGELATIKRSIEYADDDDAGYDIRGGKSEKPAKTFDKQQIDAQLKLFQLRNEIYAQASEGEEKEGNSLNIFFVPITKEDFEAMKTVEISEGSDDDSTVFNDDESKTEDTRNALLGIEARETSREMHYEIDEDGKDVLVIQ